MTADEMLAEFSAILRDLLGNDAIDLTATTRRPDVPDWDSFNYVNFIVAVEMKFGVKFGVAEVESFQTVGDIVQRTLHLMQSRRG